MRICPSGGFNDANGTCWDVEFVINACLAGKQVVVYDEVLSVFRIHHDSVSGSAFMYNEYLTDMNNLFHRLSGRQVQVADRYRRFVYNLERIPQRIRLIPFCLKKNSPVKTSYRSTEDYMSRTFLPDHHTVCSAVNH